MTACGVLRHARLSALLRLRPAASGARFFVDSSVSRTTIATMGSHGAGFLSPLPGAHARSINSMILRRIHAAAPGLMAANAPRADTAGGVTLSELIMRLLSNGEVPKGFENFVPKGARRGASVGEDESQSQGEKRGGGEGGPGPPPEDKDPHRGDDGGGGKVIYVCMNVCERERACVRM